MSNRSSISTIRRGMVAGAAGGLAEIAWVAAYAALTGGDAGALARGVTKAAAFNGVFPGEPISVGLSIHMTLAVFLGIALAFGWRAFVGRRPEGFGLYPFMVFALAGVWTINFFVVLPLVSPAFAHALPYGISLASKILFGLAAAETFRRQGAPTTSPIFREEFAVERTLS